MLKDLMKQIKISLIMLVLLGILTGFIYPLFVTLISNILFPYQADGSFITINHKKIGSELIGQYFNDSKYFWGRPSSTEPFPYNSAASSGSNLGPNNPILREKIKERIQMLKKSDSGNTAPIPINLVTASGSGLDPEITISSANYQASRIAKARGLKEEEVIGLIQRCTAGRQLGILGETRVNILKLNLELDKLGGQIL